MANSGINPEIAGQLVGHSNLKTTAIYTHYVNETLKQASKAIDDELGE